jgi:hypothetical protein
MKPIATALAVLAVLAGGAVFAVDQPSAPVATPVKKMSLKACNKQADEKKLAGKERAQYIKECRTKTAPLQINNLGGGASSSSAPSGPK